MSSKYVGYGVYFYFSGLSSRKAADNRLSDCYIIRNHGSIWNRIQKYNQRKRSSKKKKIFEYVIDETVFKVGSEHIWIWVAIELESKEILGISVSKEQNMFADIERFISDVVEEHGKHPVFTDGGTWYTSQACKFLKLDHHIHFSFEKVFLKELCNISKTEHECFDDYFPCRKKKCKLEHVKNWLNLFVDYHNRELHLK